MEVSVRCKQGVVFLDVVGEVIGQARFDLNNEIQKQLGSDCLGVVVNLEKVQIIDPVFLGMLIANQSSAKRKGKRLIISDPGRSVQYLFVMTKVEHIFRKDTVQHGSLEFDQYFESEDEIIEAIETYN